MKAIRLVTLFLALLMCLSAFAGCSQKTPDTDETTTSPSNPNVEETTELETKEELHPEIAKKDYGEEFYFTIMTHVNRPEYYWADEPKNNNLSDAIFNRQLYIQDYLGVEMFGKPESDPNLYITNFQTAVKNQDDSVHMLLSHCSTGIDGFITGNYFLDYNDMTSIDLDADYWNYDFMEGIEINGHMYLGYSDFNICYTNVVAFNKEMYDLYADAIEDSFYTLVSDYRWTLDKMISIASIIYADTTADGKTTDDTFGFTADYEVPYMSLLQACNINTIEMDDNGEYKVSVYNEKNKKKVSDLCDKLYNFVRQDFAYFDADKSYGIPASVFVGGRALMYLARTTTLPGFLDDDIDFGVLPYPMYDEAQKDVGYRSLQWGGYICLPSYLKNPTMVYETIEMLSFASEDVNIAYYEKLLGKQVADAPQDREMLDMVWDSACSDFGLTYASATGGASFSSIIPAVTKMGTTQSLASYVATNETKANKNLKKFINKVSK